MTLRKVPLRELAGVELYRVERLGMDDQVLSTRYQLVTPTSSEAQIFERELDAHKGFDRGVRSASMVDHPALSA